MTLKAYKHWSPLQQTRTMATLWSEGLAEERLSQAASRIPRSQESWSAEEARLGSWRTGVSPMVRPPGIGEQYSPGYTTPRFQIERDRNRQQFEHERNMTYVDPTSHREMDMTR